MLHRFAFFPLAILAGILAAMVLMPGSGCAQEAAGESEPAGKTPSLHVETVIMPKAVIVETEPEQPAGTVETNAKPGDPADGPDGEAERAAPRTFRIGIVPRGNTGAFLRTLEPFRAGIARSLGRGAEILVFSNFAAMIDAQVLRRIDLGFYSASAYALADKACSCLDPLVAPAAEDGSMAFHSIIVARRQSDIASIDDLKGREIAAGAPDSVGSRRVQLAELAAAGIDVGNYFSSVRTARSAVDAILMVRDDRVDAAFAWSSLTGDAGAGYSRGPLAFLIERGELNMDEIAIIWRSGPIAHAPVAVAKSLPGDVRRALADFFVRLSDNDPDTYDRLERDYGGGYRAVRRQDYAAALILANQDISIREAGPTLQVPQARPQPPAIGGQGAN